MPGLRLTSLLSRHLLLSVAYLLFTSTALLAGEDGLQPVPSSERPVTVSVTEDAAALVKRLGSNNSEERKNARNALLELGPETLPALLERIEDPYFRTRWEVVNTLGYLEDERALLPLVDRVIFDPNPHVRWRSMWALTALNRDDEVTTELVRRMSDNLQRWNAAVGLCMFARPEAIPVLLEGLASDDSWVRFEAAFCLGRSYDENTSKALVPLLDHPELKTRQTVVMSLGKIQDKTAIEGLMVALDDPEHEVRWRAAMNLRRADDPRVVPALSHALESEDDEMVIKHLRKSLDSQ